jgi:hypothetical protein
MAYMLKIIFIACLCISCLSSIAQTNNPQVVEATTTPIQGHGNDSLGNLIKIDGLHSYMFLKDCHQTTDSLGFYRTDFEFGNPNRIIAYQIMIILQLDGTADSVIFRTDGIAKDLKTIIEQTNSAASWQASQLSANATVTATIFSKKKLFTSITGVEGQLH